MVTANDDAAITYENTPVTIDVRENDDYVEDEFTVWVFRPANGTASDGDSSTPTDGIVTYTPRADWTGVDTFTYTLVHTLAEGVYAADSATVTITVEAVNHAPTDAVIVVTPSDPMPLTSPCLANVTFVDEDLDDPGAGESHTVTWDWGDESECVTVDADGTSCTCDHQYATPGVYQVRATVTDAAGAQCPAVSDYVIVYDPDGGFVTGGGWFWSLPGAYVADPELEGKATFGFVSKYLKKAEVPTGNTEFHFQVADLNFHSDAYDWLVVAGTKAMFKGTGTINGEGSYKFMISANDGDPDMFRIRIWEEVELVETDGVEEIVIYDNQLSNGDMDNGETGTVIEGGSIVVKTK